MPVQIYPMRRFSQVLLLIIGCLSQVPSVFSQCSPSPNTGGTTFAYGVTDSITPAVFEPQPFVACDNSLIYYSGNNPDTIYMESSSRLVVRSSFNLVVYLRNNCQLHIDTTSPGLKHFKEIVYDPTFTMFVDTAGITVVNGLTSCPGLTYSYASFPNGVSPCTLPSAIVEGLGSSEIHVYPQPAQDRLNISVPISMSQTMLTLTASDGRLVGQQLIGAGNSQIDISNLSAGIYILMVSNSKQRIIRRIVVE